MASRNSERGSGLVQRMQEQAWWLRLSLLQLAFLVQELRTIANTSTPSSEDAAAEVDRIWASFYCAPPPI